MMQVLQHYVEAVVIPLQLVLAMAGMGATLSGRDFADVLRDGKGLALGLTLQLILVPTLTYAFIRLFELPPGWAVGLVLVAVIPGGAYSNLLTFIGRGNTPLSVSVTLVSTAGAIITVPLLLELLAEGHMPADFSLPVGKVVRDIGLFLLLPLLVGMIVLRTRPRFAATMSKMFIRASLAFVLLVIVSSLGSGRIRLPQYGWEPPLLIIAYGTLLAVAAPLACRALGRYDDDTVALSAEVTVRNVGLALFLTSLFFPGQEEQGHVLFTVLFYGGMQNISGLPVPLMHRAGHSPIFFMPRKPRP